jgi:hypothetical protein
MVASELASVVLEGTYWMLLSGGLPLTTISTSFFNIFLHIIFFFVFLYSFYGSFLLLSGYEADVTRRYAKRQEPRRRLNLFYFLKNKNTRELCNNWLRIVVVGVSLLLLFAPFHQCAVTLSPSRSILLIIIKSVAQDSYLRACRPIVWEKKKETSVDNWGELRLSQIKAAVVCSAVGATYTMRPHGCCLEAIVFDMTLDIIL